MAVTAEHQEVVSPLIEGEGSRCLFLFGGEWKQCVEGRTVEVRSPVDGSVVGEVQAMTREEIDVIMADSTAAQKEWERLPVERRAVILHKAADLLEQKVDVITEMLMMEVAKNRHDSHEEVMRSSDFIRFTAEEAKRMGGETFFGDAFPGFKKNKIGFTFRVALGNILCIPPFNYPVNLAVAKIAPALVAGNAVILKPATQGSITGIYLTAIFLAAGVPTGVFHAVTGRGSEIGDYLVTHPQVSMISFTGSTETGHHLARIAGMIPLMMELGGKDAAIVLSDADLEQTALDIASGAFAYSGQRCTAVKRILVTDTAADALVARLIPDVEALTVGMPDDDAVVTPLIDTKSADFVQGLIDDALAKGATLLTGNRREGNLIWPTMLDHVTEDMRIAWEEPFGPVLPIIRVPNASEAVRIANASEYGLQGSIFSRNIDNALRIAAELEVGTVQVNGKTARGPDHFPFLGTKSSGMGTQGIRHSIQAMTRVKSIVFNVHESDTLDHIS
jgi:glyceraldehyde-3-phosphate dehydrogenase (NADP+)